jgi:hypothetical protein
MNERIDIDLLLSINNELFRLEMCCEKNCSLHVSSPYSIWHCSESVVLASAVEISNLAEAGLQIGCTIRPRAYFDRR